MKYDPIKEIQDSLEDILKTIIEINDITGTTQRYNGYRNEILMLGWDNVCQKYHPDNNIDDPANFQVFNFVKFVYTTMKQKGEI